MSLRTFLSFLFFFNDTATTEIYTLSLHDALPIFLLVSAWRAGKFATPHVPFTYYDLETDRLRGLDRKSTRLNSSHTVISYAVFCLKKKRDSTRCFLSSTNSDAAESGRQTYIAIPT